VRGINNPQKNFMSTTATKIQKLSDKVYQILSEKGFSKLFSWDEYVYFRKETAGQPEQAKKIAELFIFWNSHEVSDFADYEF
jgi:hypothetical protein